MKKILLLFILITALQKADCQVRFESLTWYSALHKAKEENKTIFIDMYTTWCTYCKQMDATTFANKEVGDYYNEHFINLKYDALKGDGIQIRKNYSLLGFPTFLYLDPNGLVLLKTAGYLEKEKFIQNGDSAFVRFDKKQYSKTEFPSK